MAKKEIWEWIRSIGIAVAVALLVRFFIFEVFVVDGLSMYPTLDHRERLVVNKLVYRFEEPQCYDIIVFKYDADTDYIKRVVATGGDEIEVRDGVVYRNGEPLAEEYLVETGDHSFYGPEIVPPGHVFVMGDNRRDSKDSRDAQVGFVSLERIKGKAVFVFWPLNSARLIDRS